MKILFIEGIGVSPEVLNFVILPLLIFFARVCDVSIATIRIMFVMSGKKKLAPFLGFFEAFIWLIAIGQIIQNIDSVLSYFAYAGGFAAGTFVGMFIEEKLALGRVVMRIITKKPAQELVDFLQDGGYRFASIDGEGNEGKVNIIFTVIKRDQLSQLIHEVKLRNPNAFYTVEGVKRVSDDDLPATITNSSASSRFFNLKGR